MRQPGWTNNNGVYIHRDHHAWRVGIFHGKWSVFLRHSTVPVTVENSLEDALTWVEAQPFWLQMKTPL